MDPKICLSLGTLGHLDYETQLHAASQAGFEAVGLHMLRLEEYLYSGHTLDEATDCLRRNHLEVVEVNFLPDWVSAKGKAQRQILARAEYICSTMELMECPLVIANSLGEKGYDPAVARENFGELCRVASQYGVKVGLEHLPWTSLNTLKKAWEIVRAVDHPNGGIVLDTFHYFKGHPSPKELYEVPLEKLFLVHLDDVEDVKTDLVTLTRKHRVAPGEGIFVFDEVLEYLSRRGYEGYFSLEILNATHPHQDPVALARRLRSAAEKLLIDYRRRHLGSPGKTGEGLRR